MTWLALQLGRKFAPVVVLALAASCAFLLISCGVMALALSGAHTDLANAHTAAEKALRIQAEGYSEQVSIAKADFEDRVRDSQATADQLTKELTDAREHESRLAADIKSGAVRVRRELCAAQGVRGQDTSSAAGLDERGAADGSDLAAAAIGAGDQADARLKACIAIAKRDRKP